MAEINIPQGPLDDEPTDAIVAEPSRSARLAAMQQAGA